MADNQEFEPGLFYNLDNNEADNPSEPVEEVVNEAETLEEEEAQPAEDELDESEAEESDEGESLYIEFEGLEVSFDEVKEWKQAFKDKKSMQADYTRKNQERSRLVKEEAQRIVGGEMESLKALIAEMEVASKLEDNIDMNELREDDLSEYLRVKELKETREKLLKEAKAKLDSVNTASNVDIQAEQQKLMQSHPEWVKEGKVTEAYTADMKLIEGYAKTNGWTNEEFNAVSHANNLEALLKAAKYDALQSKAKSVKKKVRTFSKSKTSVAQKKPEEKSLAELFYNKT